jgi:hypothetical protein
MGYIVIRDRVARSLRVLMTVFLFMAAGVAPSVTALQAQGGPPPPDFLALSDSIESVLKAAKYEAGTARQGSVYLFDMQTAVDLEVNPNVTYSGVSLSKIAVLVTFYQYLNATNQPTPTPDQAVLLTKMMLCSDNAAANALLEIVSASPQSAVAGLSETMWMFARSTLIHRRPFSDDGTPTIVDGPVIPNNADADPDNQLKPANLAPLLIHMKYCARSKEENMVIRAGDCRRMLALMRANQIGALIEGGVPEGTPVAHKQGWNQDTHGDAAYVSTPGGDYVLVIVLHQRKFLNYTGSFPVMAEISRIVYNAYNPTRPMKAIRAQPIPEGCLIPTTVLSMLTSADPPLE